jgi:hypothetical protein
MKFPDETRLFLRDAYLYDIEACHYNLLKQFGYDVTNIPYDNKETRNIIIGNMMRDDSGLSKKLRDTTNSIIDFYIEKNGIKDILLRQYDGIITQSRLSDEVSGLLPLHVRKHFEVFIISINKDSYIARASTGKITVKGVPYLNDRISLFYRDLCNLNYLAESAIFNGLQKIKDRFLASTDTKMFSVQHKESRYSIFIKSFGEIEVSEQALSIMDSNDIDKERYFTFYLTPFTKSIVLEFLGG